MTEIYCDYPKKDLPCEGLVDVGIDYPSPGIKIQYKKIDLDNFIKEHNQPSGEKITKQEKYVLGEIEGVKMITTTSIGLYKTIIFATKNNMSYIISFT